MRHLDLFSGIGGFALAVEELWPDAEHIFCEIDPFCQQVLKKHFPNSPIHADIKMLKANDLGRIDLLTGGFPCQPFSQAGKQRGEADDRYLWPEMLRVIRESKPTWIIGENVAGIINLALEQVCSDLESEGYEVQPLVIPACAVNAPHRRDRVWIVAHSRNGENATDTKGKQDRRLQQRRLQRHSGAAAKQIASDPNDRRQKEYEQQTTGDKQCSSDVKDAISERGDRRMEGERQILECRRSKIENARSDWKRNWVEVATEFCGVDDGLYKRLHQAIIGRDECNKISDTEKITAASGFTRESLRALWKQRATATPSSYLYQLGLCNTLPDLSCESGQERWHTQEQTAQKMRSLWNEFYSQSHTEAQDVQQPLLDSLREIERNEAVVIKKDDKGVRDVWCRVYLPSGKTNNMLKELCEHYGLAKEEVEIISASRHRTERLKALGNAIVPQVAAEIMKAIHPNTLKP